MWVCIHMLYISRQSHSIYIVMVVISKYKIYFLNDTEESQAHKNTGSCFSLPSLQERASLLRKFDEELDEARRESVQSNKDAEVQKEEAQGLREELLGEKEKMRRATGENRHLSACIRKLSQELDELHGKHRVTGSSQSTHPSASVSPSVDILPLGRPCSVYSLTF